MSRLLELRRRIQSVENIQTITRTLATVAAAKLARTRVRAAGLREYTRRLREILLEQQRLVARGVEGGRAAALLEARQPVRSVILLVVSGDRGMCGGYNLEVCREAAAAWSRHAGARRRVRFVVKGRKAAAFLRRRGGDVLHEEAWRREGVGAADVDRLLQVVLRPYESGEVEEVWAVYTEFHSPIRRRARVVRLLPVDLGAPASPDTPAEAGATAARWCHEPSRRELVDELLDVYLRAQLCGVLLQSYASEQGARMISMEEASERADRALQECRVQHNRLRREAITLDLLGALFASSAATPPPAARRARARGGDRVGTA